MAEPKRLVFDLGWLGRPGLIGAWRDGDLLVDCGPSTCLEALLEACGEWRPKALLLTHIHFDHAGAAGELTRRWPDLEVYVHRNGARHLAAPERLEASARRVFGDDFDRRFGPMLPVPSQNIRALDGGETVHGMVAEATPGHAKHHLAFFGADGSVYAGDVAGARLGTQGPVLLPAPPPDIDFDQWDTSLRLITERRPRRLLLPHFGEFDDPEGHLDAVRAEMVRQRELAGSGSAAHYVATMSERLARRVPEQQADYELVIPLEQNYLGLRRWTESLLHLVMLAVDPTASADWRPRVERAVADASADSYEIVQQDGDDCGSVDLLVRVRGRAAAHEAAARLKDHPELQAETPIVRIVGVTPYA